MIKAANESDADIWPLLADARSVFRSLVQSLDHSAGITILHDFDADGVSAGVVLTKALTRAGFQRIQRIMPDRERTAWTEANLAMVRNRHSDALFVLDLGCGSELMLEGVRTCFIDHHRPQPLPRGGTLISGYSWEPPPNTSLLVYELCDGFMNLDGLDWIAALGTISDLGEHAPFRLLRDARTRYGPKWLKEATTLVNAARRSSEYDPETAVRAVFAAASPRELVDSDSADSRRLRAARAEVSAALKEAKKAPPSFSGKVALIRANSSCQIHPLIAQIWRSRLPKYIVIAANEDYVPGKVVFSVRSSGQSNVLDFLKGLELQAGEGHYGNGHDHASGGCLPVERWNQLLAKIGFHDKLNPEAATPNQN